MSRTEAPDDGRSFLAGWSFTPRLVPTLAAVAVLPLLLSLGVWQLERATFKRGLMDQMAQRAEHAAVAYRPGPDDRAALDQRAFTRVIAEGRYDPARQVLLDNRTRAGKAGYEVFTPLLLDTRGSRLGNRVGGGAAGAAVLVRRGWLPLGARRDVLPGVAVDDRARAVAGTLIAPPSPGLKLGEGGYDGPVAAGAPRVVQWIDIAGLRNTLRLPGLAAGVIALDADAPDGYARDAVARTFPVPPERHHGYAVQWFALSATVVALWLGLNLKRRRVQARTSTD